MKETYNKTFSIMKGIAIISVVIGHVFVRTSIEEFVNQYHLAVFFFVSGYFFKEKYLSNTKDFFIRKIKSLYFPYIKLCILFALLHDLLFAINIYDTNWSIKESIIQIYYAGIRLIPGNDQLMGAMWFCPSLLIVSFISWGILRIMHNIKTIDINTIPQIMIIILIIIVNLIAIKLDFKSPWHIWQTIPICGIFIAGYYSHFYLNNYEKIKHYKIISSIAILLILVLIIGLNKKGYTAYLQPKRIVQENVIFVYIISLSSCFMIYLVSKIIFSIKCRLVNILCTIGEYSFSIMALHFLSFKLVNFCQAIMIMKKSQNFLL